ncbi:HEAT repeat domain-containing protein [Oscillatoria sp. CS-180]|uniref:phycobilisome degradation protein NblB n=1 Tax=Oscillatoria sp. CS-180 TaxID=3021720 RepID=UPI00232D342E|nr:HEAT repeat domain-containing protein [Oscillatoria sp. CS-180]MDB9529874.1 HEAT repeat domain-containing protein [Oscillatoria sp. CS-180]
MSPTPNQVKQLIESSDLGERLRGVNQARDLDPADSFGLIVTACKDDSPRVRYAAMSQMDTIGNHNRQQTLDLLRDALLNDPEADVQSAAADALGGLQMTEAFEDLRSVYETTEEWLLKFSIIAALGEMGDARAFDMLASAIESDITLVSTAAIGSLGELGDPRAVPLLLPYVDADDWQVRHRVTQALGQFDSPQAKAALEKLSQDTSATVADAAKRHIP